MTTAPGYMLDTNVFNFVLDGKVEVAALNGRRLFATHIQHDELSKTKDERRRANLLAVFEALTPEQLPTSSAVAGISVAGGAAASAGGQIPTESAVWGVSRFGQAKWGANDNIFEGMRGELDSLNKAKRNNSEDILIAETALRNGFVLLTSDRDLMEVCRKYGGACEDARNIGVA